VSKEKPAAAFRYGSGFRKLCCDARLHSYAFELPHHNRLRAAVLVPMMIGTMVEMVSMMGSTKSHILLVHFLNNRSYT
jgi:hypothetical protein